MTPITAALLHGLPLPRHQQGDNKEGRGQVLVVGGSMSVPGAILLSAEAALRVGAGKLQIATCRSIAPHLGLRIPESMVIPLPEAEDGEIAAGAAERLAKPATRADAILVGPGMMASDGMEPLLSRVLAEPKDGAGFVLDAGALDVLPGHPGLLSRCGSRTVITPHAGEMARLLDVERDAVEADPLRHARDAASRFGCIVVMKGGTTHIVTPANEAWVFEGGTVGLATSGSGDVLAGVIAGLLARGTPAHEAAVWGVFLHAEAGTRLTRRHGGVGLLARELSVEVPAIMVDVALGV